MSDYNEYEEYEEGNFLERSVNFVIAPRSLMEKEPEILWPLIALFLVVSVHTIVKEETSLIVVISACIFIFLIALGLAFLLFVINKMFSGEMSYKEAFWIMLIMLVMQSIGGLLGAIAGKVSGTEYLVTVFQTPFRLWSYYVGAVLIEESSCLEIWKCILIMVLAMLIIPVSIAFVIIDWGFSFGIF